MNEFRLKLIFQLRDSTDFFSIMYTITDRVFIYIAVIDILSVCLIRVGINKYINNKASEIIYKITYNQINTALYNATSMSQAFSHSKMQREREFNLAALALV